MSTKSTRSIRTLVARTAAVVALAGSGIAATAAPSSAAAFEKACFSWSSGGVYAGQPVYLEQWTGQWTSIRGGTTNSYGCASFSNVPTGAYTTIHAYKAFGNGSIGLALFSGYPGLYANPGTGGVNLGHGYVSLIKCVAGLYAPCAGF